MGKDPEREDDPVRREVLVGIGAALATVYGLGYFLGKRSVEPSQAVPALAPAAQPTARPIPQLVDTLFSAPDLSGAMQRNIQTITPEGHHIILKTFGRTIANVSFPELKPYEMRGLTFDNMGILGRAYVPEEYLALFRLAPPWLSTDMAIAVYVGNVNQNAKPWTPLPVNDYSISNAIEIDRKTEQRIADVLALAVHSKDPIPGIIDQYGNIATPHYSMVLFDVSGSTLEPIFAKNLVANIQRSQQPPLKFLPNL